MGRVAMAHTGILTNTSGHTKLTPECQFIDVTKPHCQVVAILVKNSKNFGGVQVVYLTLFRGKYISILGPTGCGKTTLLRMICGFFHPSDGSIVIDGKDVVGTGLDRRPTNMVFQGNGLFPHMTVIQNIAYGLRVAKVAKRKTQRRVRDAIELVRLEDLEIRSTADLSCGQQQCVALPRTLARRRQVLLLDESLAVLDLQLRKAIQTELYRLYRSTGRTFVFITHDQEEAMALATRIVVMDGSEIIQEGCPEKMYNAPNNPFVSIFLGDGNILESDRINGKVHSSVGFLFENAGPEQAVVCVVRPEKVAIALAADDPALSALDFRLTGTLLDAVYRGPSVKYTIKSCCGETFLCDNRNMEMRPDLSIGQSVVVGWTRSDQRCLANP